MNILCPQCNDHLSSRVNGFSPRYGTTLRIIDITVVCGCSVEHLEVQSVLEAELDFFNGRLYVEGSDVLQHN